MDASIFKDIAVNVLAGLVGSVLTFIWARLSSTLKHKSHRLFATIVFLVLFCGMVIFLLGRAGLFGLIFSVTICTALYVFYRDSIMWFGSSGQCADNLRELKAYLDAQHRFVKPALTLVAARSVAHVLVSGDVEVAEKGTMMAIEDYIEILSRSIEIEGLAHMKIFTNVAPDEWGDREKHIQNDQSFAWEYLDRQCAIKNARKLPEKLGIQRFVFLSDDKANPRADHDFVQAHLRGRIDLYRVDPVCWPGGNMSTGKRDYIFFYDRKGNAWMIYASLLKLIAPGSGESQPSVKPSEIVTGQPRLSEVPTSHSKSDRGLRAGEYKLCYMHIECRREALHNRWTDIIHKIKLAAEPIAGCKFDDDNLMERELAKKFHLDFLSEP